MLRTPREIDGVDYVSAKTMLSFAHATPQRCHVACRVVAKRTQLVQPSSSMQCASRTPPFDITGATLSAAKRARAMSTIAHFDETHAPPLTSPHAARKETFRRRPSRQLPVADADAA